MEGCDRRFGEEAIGVYHSPRIILPYLQSPLNSSERLEVWYIHLHRAERKSRLGMRDVKQIEPLFGYLVDDGGEFQCCESNLLTTRLEPRNSDTTM